MSRQTNPKTLTQPLIIHPRPLGSTFFFLFFLLACPLRQTPQQQGWIGLVWRAQKLKLVEKQLNVITRHYQAGSVWPGNVKWRKGGVGIRKFWFTEALEWDCWRGAIPMDQNGGRHKTA